MGISFNQNKKMFHISSNKTSYIIKILDTNHLISLYWGKKLNSDNVEYVFRTRDFGSFLTNTDNINGFMIESTSLEYPSFGATDLRSPAIEFQFKDGTSATDLRYKCHNIYKGKNKLDNLPATYIENDTEAETLEITLIDSLKNVEVILSYSVFEALKLKI